MPSSTTIEFKFHRGLSGTLTDADSVLLSSRDGTFGVRRRDNLGVVVADGTAMTHASTGVYTKTFDDPAGGLTYEWVAEVAFGGSTIWFPFTALGGNGAAPEGEYADYIDLVREIGSKELRAISDYTGNDLDDEISDNEQDALEFADAEINERLATAGYTIPPTKHLDVLRYIARKIAAYELYQAAGLLDDDAKGNHYRQKRMWADDRLQRLISENAFAEEDTNPVREGVFTSFRMLRRADSNPTDEFSRELL